MTSRISPASSAMGPCALFVVIAVVLAALSWKNLATQVIPGGDLAADMLVANRIGDEGYLLAGHYSRWNFNHPGPFWFYYNHLFELLLSGTELSRFQIWSVGSVFAGAVLVSFSAVALSFYFLGGFSICYALAFSGLLVALLGYELTDLWMPNRLIAPYLAFLVCLLPLKEGHFRYLTAAVLLACILIHGYATMPLFTLPFLLGAVILGLRNNGRPFLRGGYARQWLASAGVILVFLVPIVVDATGLASSNLAKLIAAQLSFGHMPTPGWKQMRSFADELVFRNNAIGWMISAMIPPIVLVLNPLCSAQKDKLTAALGLSFVVTLVLLLYYKHTPSPIYPFVAKFYVGVPALFFASVFAPCFASSDAAKAPATERVWKRPVSCALVLLVILSFGLPLKKAEMPDPGTVIGEFASRIESDSRGATVRIDYLDHDQWPLIAGILLELDRRGVVACTTWRHMDFLYTRRQVCPAGELPTIRIVKEQACGDECGYRSGGYGLKDFSLQTISIGEDLGYESEKLYFDGWSSPEPGWRWSSGKQAIILFRTDTQASRESELVLNFGTLGRQRIVLSLNSHTLYSGEVESSDYRIGLRVPAEFWNGTGTNSLLFELPDARPPGSSDARVLALSFKSLSAR